MLNFQRTYEKYNLFWKEKNILPLIKKELNSDKVAKVGYTSGNRILKKIAKNRNYRKAGDHCHYSGRYKDELHNISQFEI